MFAYRLSWWSMILFTGFFLRDCLTELLLLDLLVPSREITDLLFTLRGVIGFGDTLSSWIAGSGCEYSILYNGLGCFFFRLAWAAFRDKKKKKGEETISRVSFR